MIAKLKFSNFCVPNQYSCRANFEGVLGPYFPKYGAILVKTAHKRQYFSRQKQCLKNLEKSDFLRERAGRRSSTFTPILNPHYPLKMTEIEKNKYFRENLEPLDYQNMSKSRPYLLSPFREKYNYFLHYLGYICLETGQGHTFKGQNQNLAQPILPTRFLVNLV